MKQINGFKNQFTNKILYYLFFFLLFLTILQQLPIVRENYYDSIRYFLVVCFGLLALIFFITNIRIFKIHLIKIFALTILISAFVSFLSLYGVANYNYLLELIISFGALVIGFNLPYKERNFGKLLILYSFFAILMGVFNVAFYVDGFNITTNYSIPSKNQLGPIISTSIIILIYFAFFYKNKDSLHTGLTKTLYLFLSILGLFVLLVIRNRAGIFALAIVLVFFCIKYFFKNIIHSIFIISVSIIVILSISQVEFVSDFYNFVWDSVFLNYDTDDLNSISANRLVGYLQALNYINQFPLFGSFLNYSSPYFGLYPHNYVLRVLVENGIILGVPYILLYGSLFLFLIFNLRYRIFFNVYYLSIPILLQSILISLLEYTYPYGPGVTQILLLTFIGVYFNLFNQSNNLSYITKNLISYI